MNKQASAFVSGEADKWHDRNKDKPRDPDKVMEAIEKLAIKPKQVLEIGCGDGRRLGALYKKYECHVCGIDPSWKAIQEWLDRKKSGHGIVGTADRLPGGDERYDLVIFGFCLYVCDREDLFRIVMESDRVLQNKGYLVIHDFFSEAPHSRAYAHAAGLRSFKMDHARLWMANPAYTLVDQCVFDAGDAKEGFQGDDNRLVVSVLKKDTQAGWPLVS